MKIWGIPLFYFTIVLTFLFILYQFCLSIKTLIANKDPRTIPRKIQVKIWLIFLAALCAIITQVLIPVKIYKPPVETIPFPAELQAGYMDCAKEAMTYYGFKDTEPFADGFVEKLKTIYIPEIDFKEVKPFLPLFLENQIRLAEFDMSSASGEWVAHNFVLDVFKWKKTYPSYTPGMIFEVAMALHSMKQPIIEAFELTIGSSNCDNQTKNKLYYEIDKEIYTLLNPIPDNNDTPISMNSIRQITERFSKICTIIQKALLYKEAISAYDLSYCHLNDQLKTAGDWKIRVPYVLSTLFLNDKSGRNRMNSDNSLKIFEKYNTAQIYPLLPSKPHYNGDYYEFFPPDIHDLFMKNENRINGILQMGVISRMMENPDSYNTLIHDYTRKWELKEKVLRAAHQELVAKHNISVTTGEIHQYFSDMQSNRYHENYEKFKKRSSLFYEAVQSVVEMKMDPYTAIATVLKDTKPAPLLVRTLESADAQYLEEVRRMIPISPEETGIYTEKQVLEKYLIAKAKYPAETNDKTSIRRGWYSLYQQAIREYIKENMIGKRPEFMELLPEDIILQ